MNWSGIQKSSADVAKRTLTMEEVKRVPGTFGDPVSVIQSLQVQTFTFWIWISDHPGGKP